MLLCFVELTKKIPLDSHTLDRRVKWRWAAKQYRGLQTKFRALRARIYQTPTFFAIQAHY